MNRMIESVKNRRTIRKYSEKDVPDTLLRMLLDAAGRTQTMGNLQLYSVVVTRSAGNEGAPVALTFQPAHGEAGACGADGVRRL